MHLADVLLWDILVQNNYKFKLYLHACFVDTYSGVYPQFLAYYRQTGCECNCTGFVVYILELESLDRNLSFDSKVFFLMTKTRDLL